MPKKQLTTNTAALWLIQIRPDHRKLENRLRLCVDVFSKTGRQIPIEA
ncbi:hypothetical protein Mal52_17690 [Symmachiella dynata]|uniref:Uncharacterized protein n=1 Tax=Symmachiella dynata TaxID=2527995 RepID=A0A517ZLF7_9PLAN|nr:hypothetical protein Mal52_17690 [Symmachiella dynata]